MTREPEDIEDLIDVPPEDQMGPAMQRLPPMQRRFVCALAVFGGDRQRAYVWAGYNPGTRGAQQANSSALYTSVNVQLAIKEEALRRLDGAGLLAVSTLVELAMPGNDGRLRKDCAVEILNRTGMHAKSEHQIVIKDERTTQELIDYIRSQADLASRHGIDLSKVPGLAHQPVIDAEFEEVPMSAEGLEDLL